MKVKLQAAKNGCNTKSNAILMGKIYINAGHTIYSQLLDHHPIEQNGDVVLNARNGLIVVMLLLC